MKNRWGLTPVIVWVGCPGALCMGNAQRAGGRSHPRAVLRLVARGWGLVRLGIERGGDPRGVPNCSLAPGRIRGALWAAPGRSVCEIFSELSPEFSVSPIKLFPALVGVGD